MRQSLEALNHFFPPEFVASLSEEHFLYKVLCDQDPRAKMWREYTNGCLELALRYELADADLVARITKEDWESFTSAINELRCAKSLEGLFGVNSLRWHPQGRKGRIGEFEIVSSDLDISIFVEVKTIFLRGQDKLEDRVQEKLCLYAKQVPFPFFLSVTLEEVGKAEDFSGRKFKRFLKEELGKIGLIEAPADEIVSIKLPDYIDDKTGLQLKIEAHPTPPKKLNSCRIGDIGAGVKWGGKDDQIRSKLEKAYQQRPEGKQPYLVIVCSATLFPIDKYDMITALLSNPVVRIPLRDDGTIGEPKTFYKLDGFFHPQRNRQLSAIGLHRERYADKGIESTLEIYHNPFALNPIDPSIFEGKGVRQLVRTGETEMGWKD